MSGMDKQEVDQRLKKILDIIDKYSHGPQSLREVEIFGEIREAIEDQPEDDKQSIPVDISVFDKSNLPRPKINVAKHFRPIGRW